MLASMFTSGSNTPELGIRVLVFLAALALFFWVLHRSLPRVRRRLTSGTGQRIKILDRIWVEGKRTLIIVQFDDREYLVGSSEAGLSILTQGGLASGDATEETR